MYVFINPSVAVVNHIAMQSCVSTKAKSVAWWNVSKS